MKYFVNLQLIMKKYKFIIALGSNSHQQQLIGMACDELKRLVPGISFTQMLWTDPINMQSTKFLNSIAWGETSMLLNELQPLLKQLERNLGDTPELRSQGIVRIDLDLLLFDRQQLHQQDWQRPYIKQLLKEVGEFL